jgi:hypothetical protein
MKGIKRQLPLPSEIDGKPKTLHHYKMRVEFEAFNNIIRSKDDKGDLRARMKLAEQKMKDRFFELNEDFVSNDIKMK